MVRNTDALAINLEVALRFPHAELSRKRSVQTVRNTAVSQCPSPPTPPHRQKLPER